MCLRFIATSAYAHHSLRLTVLAATIVGAFPVHAQQSPAPVAANEPALTRVEVKGSSNAYDARRDDTASKIVVNHDEMVKYGDTSVVEVLKRVPGITISGSNRNTEVRMRGLGNGYTQILIDGERAPPGFAIDSLSPDVIERIEVLRVAVAEFSTQAIAGTINIVLKKAVKVGQRTFKLGYAHGAAANTPDASLQLSDRRGQLSYSLAASANRPQTRQRPHTVEQQLDGAGNIDGVRATEGNTTFDAQLLNITPRVTWTYGNGDTLTSQTYYNYNHYKEAAGNRVDTLSGPPAGYPLLDWRRDSIWRIAREELNWVHKFSDSVKLDAKLSGMYTRITSDARRTGSGSPTLPALIINEPASGVDRGLSTMGKLSSTVYAGHALAFGWDAGRTTRDAVNYKRDYPLPGVPPSDDERYGIAISRAALYVQDEWNITPNWSTYLGARWEGILIRTDSNAFATAHSRSKVWSPLFQTLYKLPGTQGDQLRFAVSRTTKAPSLLALLPLRFATANNTQYDPDTVGNPYLKPEVALGFDAGYEHHWGKGALLSASVSERRIRDYTRNILTFIDGRWSSTPINSGEARTRGLELEAKMPLKLLIDTPLALDMRASVSRNWSSVDAVPGPDNRLDAQTPLSATLGADYVSGALTLGGSYVFKNGGPVRLLVNQTAYQSVRRDLDVYALWQVDPRVQLRVAASNLLAQDRISASDFAFADAGSENTRTVTPSHRSVRATLQMKF